MRRENDYKTYNAALNIFVSPRDTMNLAGGLDGILKMSCILKA